MSIEFHGGNGMKNNNKGFSLLELLIVVAIILIIATIAIPSLLRSRQAANESAAVANVRTLNTAQVTYLSSAAGKYGDMAGLIAEKLVDDTFTGTKAGYTYTITLDSTGQDYTVDAVPASPNTGRYGYYSTPDAVVRYSTNVSLAPAGQNGRSVQ
jgi:prepilin-type N-terminal cleavage/methylation domain-containing protein